jgi:multidrug efflux system membrane fusion protein
MLSKFFNVVLALAVLGAAAAWLVSGIFIKPEEEAAVVETAAPVEVVTARLPYEAYTRAVRLSGRTEARHRVEVTARTAGVITDLPVAEGSMVTAGQVIARLSDEARAAAVNEARALVDERDADLRAGEALAAQGHLPSIEIDSRRASLAAARTSLERAITEAARGVVEAPISGILDRLDAEPGQAVNSGTVVASVIDLDPIVVIAEASERMVGEIATGAAARVTTLTGLSFEAQVIYVSKASQGATRTFRVEAEAPNPDALISAGLTAEIFIGADPRPAARITRSAITLGPAGEIGVMVVDAASRAQFVQVAIIGDEGDAFWIAGPENGAEVIVVGQDFVTSGVRVRATPLTGGGGAGVVALTER